MDPQTVAGEPIDVLVRAFRHLKCKKTSTGSMRISGTLDRELGVPFQRALMRIERELLGHDLEHAGGSDLLMRSADERRADALTALALRVAEARSGA